MPAVNQKSVPAKSRPLNSREKHIWRILNFVKTYYQDHLWEKRVNAYKNYFMYKLDRSFIIEDFQTNVKSPVVKMYVDAMRTWLYDNVINFRVMWREREDQDKADWVRSFLERGFSISDSRKELMAAVKEALICWSWYLKIWFVNKNKTIKYRKNFKTEVTEMKEQYPYVKYTSIFNFFHDPTVENAEDSTYHFERKILSRNQIKQYYSGLIKNVDKAIEDAINFPLYFSNYDYNKIKHAIFWNRESIYRIIKDNNMDMDVFVKNYLTIDYVWDFVEVIDYWTNDDYVVLFNGRAVYDWVNPLPLAEKPYVSIQYNKAPGMPFGHGLWTSLEDIQKLTDELLNLQMDNTKFQIAPMYQKIKGSDIFSFWDKQSLTYEPFKVVETNTPNAIQRLDLGSPEFTGINMIQFLLQLGEMSEWVNSYSLGYQNKVERSATWVSALVQAFKARLLPLVESMNMALSKIAEFRIATALVLMDSEIVVRINDSEWKPKFMDITLEDLIGKFDIEFDAQALKSATREVRRTQLIQLLQLAATAWVEPNTQQYILDMRKLRQEVLDAFELPQDMVLNPKAIIEWQMKIQTYSAQAQQKFAAKQWQQMWQSQWWQQYWQPQNPYGQPEASQEFFSEQQWDTRSSAISNEIPAWVTQDIIQEPALQEQSRALASAFGG